MPEALIPDSFDFEKLFTVPNAEPLLVTMVIPVALAAVLVLSMRKAALLSGVTSLV